MSEIVVNIKIKEKKGKFFKTIDRMKNIPVNNAIEILKLKYSTKGIFNRVCKGLNILAKDLEEILKKK